MIKPEEFLPKQRLFLAQKAHASTLLAATKIEEKYLGII